MFAKIGAAQQHVSAPGPHPSQQSKLPLWEAGLGSWCPHVVPRVRVAARERLPWPCALYCFMLPALLQGPGSVPVFWALWVRTCCPDRAATGTRDTPSFAGSFTGYIRHRNIWKVQHQPCHPGPWFSDYAVWGTCKPQVTRAQGDIVPGWAGLGGCPMDARLPAASCSLWVLCTPLLGGHSSPSHLAGHVLSLSPPQAGYWAKSGPRTLPGQLQCQPVGGSCPGTTWACPSQGSRVAGSWAFLISPWPGTDT